MPQITAKNQRLRRRNPKVRVRMQIQGAAAVHQRIKSMMKILQSWGPVIACMGFIFYTSSVPGDNVPSLFRFQDIVYHCVIYLALAYFFSRGLTQTVVKIHPVKVILFALLFGVLYGISDEFHQAFVPQRTVSGFDVFIDGVGSILGGFLWRLQA